MQAAACEGSFDLKKNLLGTPVTQLSENLNVFNTLEIKSQFKHTWSWIPRSLRLSFDSKQDEICQKSSFV
jgi:hypothetical protein